MTAVLYDELGPRGRRRVMIGSLLSGAVVALLVFLALKRFADQGQLQASRWDSYTNPAIWRFLGVGLLNTIKAAAFAGVIALVVGMLLALARVNRNAAARIPSIGFIEFFRGFPLLLLILFLGLGLPRIGISLPALWVLVLGLAIYNSTVLAEIIRAGILSLPKGQTEAAYAIGLTYWQTMLLVVLPQALRRMVPALVSQVITLLKDSSFGFVIPYEELLRRGQLVGTEDGDILQAFIVVAAMYCLVNLVLSRIAQRLEVGQRRRDGGAGSTPAGAPPRDLAPLAGEAGRQPAVGTGVRG